MFDRISTDSIWQLLGVIPRGGLRPKMAFYAEHFLEIQDGIVARPAYLYRRWNHALRFSLGSFRVGSHRLRVQTDHHMDRADRLCQLCTLAEVETEHTNRRAGQSKSTKR